MQGALDPCAAQFYHDLRGKMLAKWASQKMTAGIFVAKMPGHVILEAKGTGRKGSI